MQKEKDATIMPALSFVGVLFNTTIPTTQPKKARRANGDFRYAGIPRKVRRMNAKMHYSRNREIFKRDSNEYIVLNFSEYWRDSVHIYPDNVTPIYQGRSHAAA